jgi:hypothetical protein
MNLDKLYSWIIGIVISFALASDLGQLQKWIWKAQAKVIYESRASSWGSPKFFPAPKFREVTKQVKN